MGWIGPVVSVIGTIMQYSGQQKAARQAKEAGLRQQQESQFEAAQLRQDAGQEVAAAQRSALEEKRRARMVASRAAAIVGASGGGITDPAVQNLLADIEGEGAYRAGVALYRGEDTARRLRMGADTKMYEGDVAAAGGEQRASALRTYAMGSLATGVGGLYAKYGDVAKKGLNDSWAKAVDPWGTG